MPGDPKECREHAKNCWALASQASNHEMKSHFTALAERWARLAIDLEATHRLLASWSVERVDKKAG